MLKPNNAIISSLDLENVFTNTSVLQIVDKNIYYQHSTFFQLKIKINSNTQCKLLLLSITEVAILIPIEIFISQKMEL